MTRSLHSIRHEGEGDPGEAPPLVIAHGLFGSARNWGGVAGRLARGRTIIAVDMRNHGDSFHADDNGYEDMAADLGQIVVDAGGRADVLGHSMGGKAAMMLALARPEAVRRLVVADIAPVAYLHSQMPNLEAMRDLDLQGVTRRAEAERRLAERVPERAVRAFLVQNLAFEDGSPRWRLNLEALGREMDRIMGFPEVEGPYEGPALFVRGGRSDYVSPENAGRIEALFPSARFVTIEAAGHWVHAEAPGPFADAVDQFLSS